MLAGIYENVKISSETQVTEQGSLKLVLSKGGSSSSLFDSMMDGETIASDNAAMIFFPPNKDDFEGKPRSAENIAKDLQLQQMWLIEILKVYMTEENAKKEVGSEKMFLGLGLNKDNFETKLKDDTVIKAATNNLAKAFVGACTKLKLSEKEKGFRIKLVRQSKTKHFPTLPKSAALRFPWIESMDVENGQSKVVFTEYEKDNGLNSTTTAAKDSTTEVEKKDANALFNNDGKDTTINQVFPDENQPTLT